MCNIFRPNPQDFPKIQAAGDLIRLHRVKVQEYQKKVQLVGWGGAGRHASYVVIHRRENAPALPSALAEGDGDAAVRMPAWVPEHWQIGSTSDTYTFDQHDEATVMRLWAWRTEALPKTIILNEDLILGPRNVMQVQARLQGTFVPPPGGSMEHPGDLVALVLAKTENMITVWDGTGQGGSQTLGAEAVAKSIETVLKLAKTGPRWETLAGAEPSVGHPLGLALPLNYDLPSLQEFREALRRLGGRLQVIIPPEHKWRLDGLSVVPGRWIHIKSLALRRQHHNQGPEEAYFGLGTSVNPLPAIAYDVHRVAVRFLKRYHYEKLGKFTRLRRCMHGERP